MTLEREEQIKHKAEDRNNKDYRKLMKLRIEKQWGKTKIGSLKKNEQTGQSFS